MALVCSHTTGTSLDALWLLATLVARGTLVATGNGDYLSQMNNYVGCHAVTNNTLPYLTFPSGNQHLPQYSGSCSVHIFGLLTETETEKTEYRILKKLQNNRKTETEKNILCILNIYTHRHKS